MLARLPFGFDTGWHTFGISRPQLSLWILFCERLFSGIVGIIVGEFSLFKLPGWEPCIGQLGIRNFGVWHFGSRQSQRPGLDNEGMLRIPSSIENFLQFGENCFGMPRIFLGLAQSCRYRKGV